MTIGIINTSDNPVFKKIVSMKTIGDKIQDKALSKIGEKSLFTKGVYILPFLSLYILDS